jgi:3,4-dihydroxy-2-butanone 4-phosphate synthase
MFSSIDDAIKDLRNGKCILIADSADRENEVDIVIPADNITEEIVTFMVRYSTGILCVSITEERANELELPLMVSTNTEKHGCAFTVSTDYKWDTSTGVSSRDRMLTIKNLAESSQAIASDFTKPGHIFPLRAKEGGIFERNGHTEASLCISDLAGFSKAACLSELINEDGTMCRVSDAIPFMVKHNLKMISIEELIKYISI